MIYFNPDKTQGDPVMDLISSGQYRDIPRSIVDAYTSQRMSQEEAISKIKGTPLYNPALGPLTDTGQGLKTASGQSVQFNAGTGSYELAPGQKQTVQPQTGQQIVKAGAGTDQTTTAGNLPAKKTGITDPGITQNLAPGASGDEVKKLQNWLIQQGYTIPAGATGYYGDQTKAAVSAWQKANNIDTQGNPGLFGPISRNFITQQAGTPSGTTGTQAGTQATQTGTTGTTGTTDTGINQDAINGLKFLTGWTDQQVQDYIKKNPSEAFQWAMTGEYMKKQYDMGQATQQANAQALVDAYNKAVADPTLNKKYSDMAALDKASFQASLTQLSQQVDLQSQQQQTQFENERKALAEQSAQAGQAVSGFRGEAQRQLAQQESGIVQSSRAQLQKSVQDLTRQFEEKYGTTATTPATAQFKSPFAASQITPSGLFAPTTPTTETIAGAPVGGITGTIAGQKAADITSLQQNIYQGLKAPGT